MSWRCRVCDEVNSDSLTECGFCGADREEPSYDIEADLDDEAW